MPNYFKIGQGNQWLRPASATCDFRISHGTANSARCIPPLRFPAFHQIQMNKEPRGQPIHVKSRRRKVHSYRKDD